MTGLPTFDQIRTLGTDITQADDAHAIMTIDKQTTLRDLLQAAMRMRKLAGRQRVSFYHPRDPGILSRKRR